jgi:hypothetical protein
MLSSGAASAATLGPLSCTGATTTPGADLFGNLICPQFNVAGGTLTSIVLELTGSIVGSISLTNHDTANSQTASAAISSEFIFFEPPIGQPSSTAFVLQFGCRQFALTAGATGNCAPPGPLSATLTATMTSSLSPYIGGSTFAIPVETLTGLTAVGGDGFVLARSAIQASANGRVTYEYEPRAVPEPATLLLFGTGLVSLGCRWRR